MCVEHDSVTGKVQGGPQCNRTFCVLVVRTETLPTELSMREKLRCVRLSPQPLSFCACHLLSIETYNKLFLQSHKMLHENPT